LADASALKTRTKIEYTDGTKVKFKEITQSDTGIYYGVKTEKYDGSRQLHKLFIDKNEVAEVKVKDKTASTLLSITIPAIIIAIITVTLVDFSLDYGDVAIPVN
jgi:hypothetical protein